MAEIDEAEIERIDAAATPWPELNRLAKEADTDAELNALAQRITDERPYMGQAGAIQAIATARGTPDSL